MFLTRTRILMTAFVAVGILATGAPNASAQNEGIINTRHNFSTATRDVAFTNLSAEVADYGEVCVYCHTPHGGQTNAPLWNRQFTTATFTMYNAPTGGSSDLDMTFATQPTGVSLACLSCHDGTIGIDVIINQPNASTATSIGSTLTDIYGGVDPDSLRILGTDLRNDHPISMVYNPALDPQFNTVASIEGAGLRLFDDPTLGADVVQCATCHNPHTQNATFLRIPNTDSDLCLTCHIK
ncbi:MAG: cytochrome c3 family protein [Gemmatimonadota bacterium]|nr:cytochrome c3 family protein [Gemmatimonadota bacterium]